MIKQSIFVYKDIEACIKVIFFKAYRHEVLEITDSIRLCEKCKILGVKPSYVAQNMIFDGVKGIENIDKYINCKLIFD